ncbi:hypothetical protein [Rubripirellula obstinata]|uniref:hypothetical protein n=1 Tax=Rubripirellula obstinata TaxID=406547 RepID=UPI001358FC50|nr:hypothetical protein [Rubripirellula obstinata]
MVKVGGSLLKRKDLAEQIVCWTERQSIAENLFLFGGGDVINSVRQLDEVHCLDVSRLHWLCIDLLDVSFAVASSLLSDWNRIESQQQFRELVKQQPRKMNTIVRCKSFYHREREGSAPGSLANALPWDWRTTTDSLAAQLAMETNARELVLLKSCEVDCRLSHQELARRGIVDAAFPNAAKSIASVTAQRLC